MPALLVRDLMTKKVVTLFEEETLPLAEDVMRYRKLRHLPVVDEHGVLVGLVTHRDILRAAMSRRAMRPTLAERAIEDHVAVRDILTRDVWTVGPTTTAARALALLRDHKFGCLPVIDEQRRLVGIISAEDFLRLAAGALEPRRPRAN